MSQPEATDFFAALDPMRSAVVEACAGSGKTWLLASRIVRLLLAGAAPAEILAITFTRKAAREIEERVVDWLRELATAEDAAVRRFLVERGVSKDASTVAMARGLYERVTGAQPGLAVNTFHGWFLQLVAVAPLTANLAGASLADDGSRRFEELWQTFARRLQRDRESAVAQAFVRLLAAIGLVSTRVLLRQGMARRAEWLAMGGGAAAALAELQCRSAAGEPGSALRAFFAQGLDAKLQACADLFLAGNATESGAARSMLDALAIGNDEARFDAWRAALLTKDGELRQRLASVTQPMIGRLGAAGAEQAVALYVELAERTQAAAGQLAEERNFAFNRDALCVYAVFLSHLDEFKAERRQIDFIDAEWRVLDLLRDEASAAFIQAKLDARYRHVLLDEFQDTNPLQWQILLAWLEAYADAQRPTVFLVGDPKQSIYRFRRAEPRLFAAAADFLTERFGAVRLAQDQTRRNAPAIVTVVNALFSAEPLFQPFRPQGSLAAGVPGRVELLPLFDGGAEEDVARAPVGLRDPLREPAMEHIDSRRHDEAAAMAEKLSGLFGRMLVRDGGQERPLRFGDVLLLVRKRTEIAIYEQALAARGIPYAAASRGGLLDALEVRDLVALLEFLATPAANLPLAQALKSPLFACSDEDLLHLAGRGEVGWLERMRALVASGGASVALQGALPLLDAWLPAAAGLPVHDLLDRIYHEGDVMARYQAAVPEARRAAVRANLEALLLLALDLDGGRYPSLPRFIEELKTLRKADADDAPDEGELAADERLAAEGRVRILTIHGAKGLEAPLVWLLDANAAPPAARAWDVLVEWGPEAVRPTHFSFVGRKDERGASRQPLFDAEDAAAAREELNLLYVAITRAKQVFMVSGIAGARGEDSSAYGLLQATLQRLAGSGASIYGEALPQGRAAAIDAPSRAAEMLFSVPAVGERRESPDAAARFGILLHALMERLTEGAERDGWWRDAGYSDAEVARARPIAERLLASPILQRFFAAERYIGAWNEMEISDVTGGVCRVDRFVELDEAYWVLDYKSSGPETGHLDEYHAQVAAYCRALAQIHTSKPVRGGLIFADGSFVEVIP